MRDYINCDLSFFQSRLGSVETHHAPCIKALDELVHKRCLGSEWTGWFDYPQIHGFALVQQIRQWQRSLTIDYDCVVVVGIGGSYLGTRSFAEACGHTFVTEGVVDAGQKPIYYLGHHLSSKGLSETLEFLQHKSPIVNVVSKSGTTTEPSIGFRLLRRMLDEKYGPEASSQRIVATTDERKGALLQFSQEKGYRRFVVPDDIGGRYSVLTAVGLVPLALAGFAIEEMMQGAADFFAELAKSDQEHSLRRHLINYSSARYHAYLQNRRVELLAFAEPSLQSFAEWWKQLFGESEGKGGKGVFPSSLMLTTDLHSLGQYVQQGTPQIFETFLSFEEQAKAHPLHVPQWNDDRDQLLYLEGRLIEDINRAAAEATLRAHDAGGVPCVQLKVRDRMSSYSIAYLKSFFECACALSCSLMGVNPYDQPGVEDYKRNLFALMGRPGYEDLAAQLRSQS